MLNIGAHNRSTPSWNLGEQKYFFENFKNRTKPKHLHSVYTFLYLLGKLVLLKYKYLVAEKPIIKINICSIFNGIAALAQN